MILRREVEPKFLQNVFFFKMEICLVSIKLKVRHLCVRLSLSRWEEQWELGQLAMLSCAKAKKKKTRSLKAKSTYSAILIYVVTSLFRVFADLIGIDFLNRKNNIIIEFSMSELVENDTSLAFIGQLWFWRQFWAKMQKNRTRGS